MPASKFHSLYGECANCTSQRLGHPAAVSRVTPVYRRKSKLLSSVHVMASVGLGCEKPHTGAACGPVLFEGIPVWCQGGAGGSGMS